MLVVGTGHKSVPIEDVPGSFLYLGTFADGKWVTHYFEGYEDLDPTRMAARISAI
jgi:hypothetical protein